MAFSGFPSPREIEEALNNFILSASGWRKIFSLTGDEESSESGIIPADAVLAAAAAEAFAEFLLRTGKGAVVVGCDTRPTGPAVCEVLMRVFISKGMTVRCLAAAAAPEVMAYTRLSGGVEGFVYVSASHNPLGHNGLKFGRSEGALLGGEDSEILIDSFIKTAADHSRLKQICGLAAEADPRALEAAVRGISGEKEASLRFYSDFIRHVATGFSGEQEKEKQDRTIGLLETACRDRGFGIVAELNGSARTLSIDEQLFSGLGIKTRVVNGRPGEIAHRIVPEGRSLEQCRRELETVYSEDPDFLFGYVPDNDGDRGNIVYVDPETGVAHPMEAQEVFALSVAAELSYLAWSGIVPTGPDGKFTAPAAVAVNGPTSMRVDRIASFFGARVFRAEVGEARVVQLARNLRAEGYTVRILGEGSNGGNITHPSEVRDPLSTAFALIKMLRLAGEGPSGHKDLIGCWFAAAGLSRDREEYSIPALLATLPRFTTTSAYEPEGIMKIRSADHGALKARYEEVFQREWEKKKDELAGRFGFARWEEINYEGSEGKHGFGPAYRSGKQTGGLKILFSGESGVARAYIWMRGSGTEPVFRVLCDVEGDDRAAHDYLLDWHRGMIEQADEAGG